MKKDYVKTCSHYLKKVRIRWNMVPHTKSELRKKYMHSVVPHPTGRHVNEERQKSSIENRECRKNAS